MQQKNPSNETTDMVKSLKQAYPGNIVKHAHCLMIIRPLEGCKVDRSLSIVDDPTFKQSSATRLRQLAFKIDVTSIDVALTLLRHFLSLNPNLGIPEDRITPEETAFYKAAWSNIGWKLEEDREVKYQLVKKILGTEELSEEDIHKANFSFVSIFGHQGLRWLFKEHPCLNIASHTIIEKMVDEPDTAWKKGQVDLETFLQVNELKWDGILALEIFVNRRFAGVKRGNHLRVHFSARPFFFSILYEPRKNCRLISETRSFKMAGYTLKPDQIDFVCDDRKHTYVIAAIIRLGDNEGLKDDIRTYTYKGKEIKPHQTVGGRTEEIARLEYEATGKRWSIEDKGRYMLFYYRISNREGETNPETYISKDGPEFEPRDWCQDDIPMTDAPVTSNGGNDEASKKRARPVASDDDSIGSSNKSRFISNDNDDSRSRNGYQRSSGAKGKSCYHCGIPGHKEAKCWKKNPSLHPNNVSYDERPEFGYGSGPNRGPEP
ncbi:hypothetical protein BHYA_0158g00270 [Botrytis hyacinthi]|uniref:CCHC-type domain-containing protein n=1 Tax=Botrytis hyacinthi TaxID=278943 RepID=A0A4Z1GEL5_9HELO|nr:hypothetical protein BHYA_0158g00270 [Botrytis hyacinthi]